MGGGKWKKVVLCLVKYQHSSKSKTIMFLLWIYLFCVIFNKKTLQKYKKESLFFFFLPCMLLFEYYTFKPE